MSPGDLGGLLWMLLDIFVVAFKAIDNRFDVDAYMAFVKKWAQRGDFFQASL